jgi:hypothetical protein
MAWRPKPGPLPRGTGAGQIRSAAGAAGVSCQDDSGFTGSERLTSAGGARSPRRRRNGFLNSRAKPWCTVFKRHRLLPVSRKGAATRAPIS